MPYALFPPRSPNPNHPSKPPLPKYTTADRAVAQVFHSYGWPVLHVGLGSLPPVPRDDVMAEDEDEHVDQDKEEEENAEDDQEAQKMEDEEVEEVPTITHHSGLTELHFSGIVLDRWVFEGEQVAERLKENVMWMAGWMMGRVVDLRYVGM